MYAHERSLVEKYEDQPFALLGVNTDSLDDIKKIYADNQINWRSWVQGSIDGPVPTKWNIESWPTIFLIDHEGIIRHRFNTISPDALDEMIGALVADVGS